MRSAVTAIALMPVTAMLVFAAEAKTSPERPDRDRAYFSRRVAEAEDDVQRLSDRVRFLLDQYGRDGDPPIAEMERRFAEAEIHFLLENYPTTVVLLQGIIDSPRFRGSESHGDALYYLAESLYRQESYLPARRYFLEILRRGSVARRDDALMRLMEICGKLRDYREIEDLYQRFVDSADAVMPRVRYAWGSLIFHREDIDDPVRWRKALRAFEKVPATSTYGPAARYFIGVVHTQAARKTYERARFELRANIPGLERAKDDFFADLQQAATAFSQVVESPVSDERGRRIKEQAWMALGRVFLEMGRYGEAIDAYQRVDRHSDLYYRSLYEVAWALVRRGDLHNARRAAEILLTGAGDSPLAPEIRLLLGHLHARAERYDRAADAYDDLSIEFSPVRDELDALLGGDDPEKRLGEMFARSEGGVQVEDVLPSAAVDWATTEEDVERGLAVVSGLEETRRGIDEGKEIAARIMASLDAGTLEPFPTLAEGHRRSMDARGEILRLRRELTEIEHALLEPDAPADLREEYAEARAHRERLADRLGEMPATAAQVRDQRARYLADIDALKRDVFRSRMAARSQQAQVAAMRRHLREVTRESADPEEVEAFANRLDWERKLAEQLEEQANELGRRLDRFADTVRSRTVFDGVREATGDYEEALSTERSLAARIRRAAGSSQEELEVMDRLRQELTSGSRRVDGLLEDIERRGERRREALREQALAELRHLEDYQVSVEQVAESTQGLVGRMAYDSVDAIRRHFYDLVLRSDVGIIDVAWAKKIGHSTEIQGMVEDRDRQLRVLEEEFQEVLRDPDAEHGR